MLDAELADMRSEAVSRLISRVRGCSWTWGHCVCSAQRTVLEHAGCQEPYSPETETAPCCLCSALPQAQVGDSCPEEILVLWPGGSRAASLWVSAGTSGCCPATDCHLDGLCWKST